MSIIWTTISFAGLAVAQQSEPVKPITEAMPSTPAIAGCYDSKESQEKAQAAGQVAPVPAPVALSAAEQFLTELESADQGLRTLRTGIQYDRVFELQGDRQVWEGTLLYQSSEPVNGRPGAGAAAIPAARKFMVQFDRSKIGDQVNQMDKKSFLFDGRWFVERNERLKTISRKEVFRTDEATDPMRLGDSPFPLPIGQKKADILERYEVELLEANDGLQAHEPEELPKLQTFVAGCKQLLLKPKPLDNQRVTIALNEVRLWYRPVQVEGANGTKVERWLPRMARTENKEGITIVQLIKPIVNESVTDADFVLQGGEGWLVQEDRLEQ